MCLASAIAMRPALLLLDEPTSQLDEEGARAFLSHAAGWDGAVVMSEHRLERAFELADRVICLEAGRVSSTGPARPPATSCAGAGPSDRSRCSGCAASSEATVTVVHMENVAYAYDGGPPAVLDLQLEVGRGEIVALEGPNGSGKTTAAKLAAGLLTPAAGTVARCGQGGLHGAGSGSLRRLRARRGRGRDGCRRRSRTRARRARVLWAGWAAERHARDLSSGERQRLALAAVAVSEPDLLVLDEPTRGMDPGRKHELAEWMTGYAAGGAACSSRRTIARSRRTGASARPGAGGGGEAVHVG